jgi:hypothetical protein
MEGDGLAGRVSERENRMENVQLDVPIIGLVKEPRLNPAVDRGVEDLAPPQSPLGKA